MSALIFSSPLFLCLFMAFAVLPHLALPRRARNGWLLFVSVIFYAWGGPSYLIILAAVALLDFVSALVISAVKPEKKRLRGAVLASAVVVNIGLLCFFKYTDLLIETVNGVFSAEIPALGLALPIGISFYTFQALSYVIDVFRGRVAAQKNAVDFFMYVTLFPQLIAGPIVRYSEIEDEIRGRSVSALAFSDGICRFTVGLAKKTLIADTMAGIVKAAAEAPPTTALAWCSALAFMFQIYFDFSGYSDMAIGLGGMLGFHFPENFRYPYEADSVTDFWRRWHITLSTWFREYLYIPLGGNRRGTGRQIFNLLIVWACTGLWHGGAWNFLLWGLYYFAVLVCEKLFLSRLLEKLPSILRRIYTLAVVFFGWVIFAAEGKGALAASFAALFGVGVDPISERSVFIILAAAVPLAVAAAASTHFPAHVADKLSCAVKNADVRYSLKAAFTLAVLILSLSFLVGGSYSPFLYFRF